MGFPGGSDGKESSCHAGDPVQFPRSEDPWRRKWQPTPVFCLGNPIDRGAWWATVHGFEKNQMQYSSENYTQYLITYEGKESEKYIYICVCVCVCIHTHVYTYIYTHTYICITESLCCTPETNTL